MSNREQAQKEYEAVRQWVLDEEDKATEKLKSEGKYIEGLDSNQEAYSYIYEERNRRIADIKKRYNITTGL